MKKPTESALVSCCLQVLALRRVFHWRSNNIPAPLPGGKFRRFVGMKGVADILAVLPPIGRLAGIECKMPAGRQSPDQKAFQAALEAAGGVYLLIRDVRDLESELSRLAAPPLPEVAIDPPHRWPLGEAGFQRHY